MIKGLREVLDQFSIVTDNISLYETAFTHASYANEHSEAIDYDRLEFLGDSILDMVVADLLYQKFPKAKSGQLSKMRANLVEGETLTYLSEEKYHFAELVRYSVGEKDNTRFHKHINEDVFEAFIGAIYVDKGYIFVRKIVEDIFLPLIENYDEVLIRVDPKSHLQELLASNIIYEVINVKNLNSPDVSYKVAAKLGTTILGIGEGHNIKEAEKRAATDALLKNVGE